MFVIMDMDNNKVCYIKKEQRMAKMNISVVKAREVLKMKIHKYCQFERTTNLEALLKENDTLDLLDEYDSDGKSN